RTPREPCRGRRRGPSPGTREHRRAPMVRAGAGAAETTTPRRRPLRRLGRRRARRRRRLGLELLPYPDLAQEVRHGLGRLCALAEPCEGPVLVDVDDRGLLERVVLPDDLDELAVARAALVRHHHPVVRLLLLAHPRQPDPDRHSVPPTVPGRQASRGSAASSCPFRLARPSSSASSSWPGRTL